MTIFYLQSIHNMFIVSKKKTMLQTLFSPFLNWIGQTAYTCIKCTYLEWEKRPRVFRTQMASPPSYFTLIVQKKQVIYIKDEGIRTTYDCIFLLAFIFLLP